MTMLRKLNTKVWTRFFLVVIILLSVAGTIPLVDELQSMLRRGEISLDNLKTAFIYYIVSVLILMSVLMFALFIYKRKQGSFKRILIPKALIGVVYIILFIPGFVFFPEMYGININLFSLAVMLPYTIILLAIIVQRFSEEDIAFMKAGIKKAFAKKHQED